MHKTSFKIEHGTMAWPELIQKIGSYLGSKFLYFYLSLNLAFKWFLISYGLVFKITYLFAFYQTENVNLFNLIFIRTWIIFMLIRTTVRSYFLGVLSSSRQMKMASIFTVIQKCFVLFNYKILSVATFLFLNKNAHVLQKYSKNYKKFNS